jgi:hypothetical protein
VNNSVPRSGLRLDRESGCVLDWSTEISKRVLERFGSWITSHEDKKGCIVDSSSLSGLLALSLDG